MMTVPEFSIENISSKEYYSESDEESDYHSSADDNNKVNKKN